MNIYWFTAYIVFILIFAPLFVSYLEKRNERKHASYDDKN